MISDAANKKALQKHYNAINVKVENADPFLSAIEIGALHYEPVPPLKAIPEVAFSEAFDNDTDATDPVVFKKSTTSTATFTWSFTEALKLGTKTTFETGLPKIAEGKFELSVELNLSSTQTHTETKTQTWEVDTTVNVPPRSTVAADLAIATIKYDPKFTVPIRFWMDYQFKFTYTLDLDPSIRPLQGLDHWDQVI